MTESDSRRIVGCCHFILVEVVQGQPWPPHFCGDAGRHDGLPRVTLVGGARDSGFRTVATLDCDSSKAQSVSQSVVVKAPAVKRAPKERDEESRDGQPRARHNNIPTNHDQTRCQNHEHREGEREAHQMGTIFVAAKPTRRGCPLEDI